jgi:hypothetical protein
VIGWPRAGAGAAAGDDCCLVALKQQRHRARTRALQSFRSGSVSRRDAVARSFRIFVRGAVLIGPRHSRTIPTIRSQSRLAALFVPLFATGRQRPSGRSQPRRDDRSTIMSRAPRHRCSRTQISPGAHGANPHPNTQTEALTPNHVQISRRGFWRRDAKLSEVAVAQIGAAWLIHACVRQSCAPFGIVG